MKDPASAGSFYMDLTWKSECDIVIPVAVRQEFF